MQHNGDVAPFAPNRNPYKHTFPVFFIQVRLRTPVTVDNVDISRNDLLTIQVIIDREAHGFYIDNISSCNTCAGL